MSDHPHTDPGDGRTECLTCGKWVWLVTHSCKRVPVTQDAMNRLIAGGTDTPKAACRACGHGKHPSGHCGYRFPCSCTSDGENGRVENGVWVTDCPDCEGTGVFQLPEGTDTCVPCKGTGRTIITLAAPKDADQKDTE